MSREATEPGREERFHAVLAEYLQQVESNQAPDEQNFIAQHAESAQELGQFFADSAGSTPRHCPCRPGVTRRFEILQRWMPCPHRPRTMFRPLLPAESTLLCPLPDTRRFGNYELLEEIGCGGMGVVYRAKQLDLKRIVALKMILAGRFASREEVIRFRRGAEAAAHPPAQ